MLDLGTKPNKVNSRKMFMLDFEIYNF